MTKQEEIRASQYLIINNRTRGKLTPRERRDLRDTLWEDLHSQGVVIQTRIPNEDWEEWKFEPLIEEE